MDVITFPENLYTTSGLSILLHGVDVIIMINVIKLSHFSTKTHAVGIQKNRLFETGFSAPIRCYNWWIRKKS